MRQPLSNRAKILIRAALREDVGRGDVTTEALVPTELRGEAVIEARSEGVLAGSEVVKEVFHTADRNVRVIARKKDGARFRRGEKVFLIRGRVRSILKAERTALNFLGHLSGIATLTHQFVRNVKGTRARILDTRKTTPLWRELEKQAVAAGGGGNHRFGLWDAVLVKDNHWAALSRHCEAVNKEKLKQSQGTKATLETMRLLRQRLKRFLAMTGKRRPFIEIEVDNLRQLVQVLPLRPDAVLLDNFPVMELKKAVRIVKAFRKKPLLEASGGVHLGNIKSIARTGVDRISVGTLTHSAPAMDFSLEF